MRHRIFESILYFVLSVLFVLLVVSSAVSVGPIHLNKFELNVLSTICPGDGLVKYEANPLVLHSVLNPPLPLSAGVLYPAV